MKQLLETEVGTSSRIGQLSIHTQLHTHTHTHTNIHTPLTRSETYAVRSVLVHVKQPDSDFVESTKSLSSCSPDSGPIPDHDSRVNV